MNDFSRTLSTVVWEPLIPKSAVTIFSGGTEGVLSPHVTFIVQERATTGLVASVGRTGQFEPQEIGTVDQALQVSSTVRRMMNEAEVFVEDVKLVLVKCPLLTSAKMEAVKAAGRTPITTDTYYSMAKSRYASAVGVAAALDEISPSYNGDLGQVLSDGVEWSSIASCSSGAEVGVFSSPSRHPFLVKSISQSLLLWTDSDFLSPARRLSHPPVGRVSKWWRPTRSIVLHEGCD